MNSNILPAAVIAWLKNQGAQLLQAGKAPGTGTGVAALEVGTVYEARVLQKLPQGRHLVQIGEQPMSLALPGQNKPGDAVKLLYLRADPRPTFMLVRPEPAPGERNVQVSEAATRVASLARWSGPPQLPSATQQPIQAGSASAPAPGAPGGVAASAAQFAAQAPVTTQAAARPGTGGQIAATVLSGGAVAGQGMGGATADAATESLPVAARLLAAGLSELGQAGRAMVRAGVPLMEHPSSQGQAWLAPLKQAVKDSGLFYEANLGRWTRGEQGLDAVQRQPQARLGDAAQLAQSMRVAELDGMPEEVARIAGRQLHMLEGQPFLWQGLAWPGQRMDWLIEERQGGGGGEEEAPQWQTELRLALPNLGGVAAEIVLQPRGLRLRLAAENSATEARMREALPELAGRLDAAGVSVLGLMVEARRETDGQEPPSAG